MALSDTTTRHEPAERAGFFVTHTRQLAIVAAVVSYVVLAAVANAHAWLDGPGHTLQLGGGIGDVGQSVWFLGHGAHALLHGQGILTTHLINAPHGYNLMANTSMVAPSLLLSPITWLFGPVVTFNVAVVLGFSGSATAMFFVLRRYTTWLPAAYVGGLIYGFSPAMTSAGSVHLHLILAPLPPIMFLLLDELVARQRSRWWTVGLLLGVLSFLQLLTASETLANVVLLSIIGLAIVAVANRSLVVEHLRHAVMGLGAAVGSFIVLAAYPLWVQAAGPGHIRGAEQQFVYSRALAADALSFFLPTSNQLIAPSQATRVTDPVAYGNLAENGAYVGMVLVVVLLAITIRWWRVGLVRLAAAMTVISAVLSMGYRVVIDRHVTSIPLPFDALAHLPIFNSASASRDSILTGLFVALLAALGLDRFAREGAGTVIAPGRTARLVGVVIFVIALVPLIPSWPYPSAPTRVPTFFATNAQEIIPTGSVVLTDPLPQVHRFHDEAMVWQALNGYRYSLVGAYGHVRNARGTADLGTSPPVIAALFEACAVQPLAVVPTASTAAAIRRDLASTGAQTIVITPTSDAKHATSTASRGPTGPACAARVISTALHVPPRLIADAWVFTHVQAHLARQAS